MDPSIADDKGIASTWTTGYMSNYQKDAFRRKLGGGSTQASLKADAALAVQRTPRSGSSNNNKKMKTTPPLSNTSSVSSSAASGLSASPFLSVSTSASADAALVFAPDGASLSRRRCLVEDAARMPVGRRVLLVLRPGSTLYDDYYNYKDTFSLRPFALADGKSDGGEPPADNIQFLGKVHANAQGGKLVSAKDQNEVKEALRIFNGQESGGGIVLALDDFDDTTQAITFRQIHRSDVMLFDMNDACEPAASFYEDVKDIRNDSSAFIVLEQVQSEVSYDRFQMLLLHNTYLRRKLRSAYRAASNPTPSRSPPPPRRRESGDPPLMSPVAVRPGMAVSAPASDEEACEEEAAGPGMVWAAAFDAAIAAEQERHFKEGWPDTTMPVYDAAHWLEMFDAHCPKMSALTKVSIPPTSKDPTRPSKDKQHLKSAFRLKQAIKFMRNRNPGLILIEAARVEAASSILKGRSIESRASAVHERGESSARDILEHMKVQWPIRRRQQKALLCAEVEVTVVWDNFQQFIHLFTQKDGRSSTAIHGTCRAAVRRRQPMLFPGDVLCSHGLRGDMMGQFTVLECAEGEGGYSLVCCITEKPGTLTDDGSGSATASISVVTLPRLGWSVLDAPRLAAPPGLDVLTYVDQYIPPVHGMSRPAGSGSRVLIEPSHWPSTMGPDPDPNAEAISAQEYGSELRQASYLGLFKQMLATSAAAAGFGGDEKEEGGGGGGGEEEGEGGARPVQRFLFSHRRQLTTAGGFQIAATKQYHPHQGERTAVEVQSITADNETTGKGSDDLMIKQLHDVGLIEKVGHSAVKLSESAKHRHIHAFGDCKTVDLAAGLSSKLAERMVDEESSENATAAAEAMDRISFWPGQLHVLMHWLCVVFLLFYGGFLQPIQAALRRKNITRNPIKNFRQSTDLATIVYEEGHRLNLELWAATVESVAIRGQDTPLGDVEESDAAEALLALEESYRLHVEHQAKSDDAAVRFAATFLLLMGAFVMYDQSTKRQDSFACEILLVFFLPWYKLVRKGRYANAACRFIEEAFGGKLTEYGLQSTRINANVLMTDGPEKGIGVDDLCEKLNLFYKRMRRVRSIEGLIPRSQSMSWMLRCNVTSDRLNNKGPKEPKRRVEKSSKAEREVVFAILKDAAVFTEKGRLSFSGLWESAKKFVQLPRRGEASSSNDYGLGRAIEKLFGRPEAAQVDAEEDDEEEDEEGGVDGGGGGSGSEGESESEETESQGELERLRQEKAVRQLEAMVKYPVNALHHQHRDLERAARDLLSDIRMERALVRKKAERRQEQHREAAALHAKVVAASLGGGQGQGEAISSRGAWRANYHAAVGVLALGGAAAAVAD